MMPLITTTNVPNAINLTVQYQGRLRHKCKGGYTHLVAKIVDNKLEFMCDNCHTRYYWDEQFLQLLLYMLRMGQEFSFIFE